MKKLIFLIALVSSVSAWSNTKSDTNTVEFNKNCATAYRTGSIDMLKLIKEFNNQAIDTKELAASSASVSAQVAVIRTACTYFESPEAKSCSDRYKAIYSDVRSKVSAGALLTGTQTEVAAGRAYANLTEGKLLFCDAFCRKFN